MGAGAEEVILAAQKPGGRGGAHRKRIIYRRHAYLLNRIENFVLANL
jgi:hypothetical protein